MIGAPACASAVNGSAAMKQAAARDSSGRTMREHLERKKW
jgi:hypothetical protein